MDRLAYSPSEAARLLSVGRTFLYTLLQDGKLKSVRLGSRRLITRAAIDELLANNAVLR
jgi:excisionase family DNA binding protein